MLIFHPEYEMEAELSKFCNLIENILSSNADIIMVVCL